MIRLTTLVILTMFASVSNAFSQENGYVQLAGIMSTTAIGDVPEVSAQFSSTGLGGTAFGFAAEAGFFVSHRVSVGFEASVPGRFDGEQIEGSFQRSQIESRHRDLLLSGVVGVQFPIGAGASLRVETGPTVVAEDTVRRTASEILGPSGIPTGSFGPFGPRDYSDSPNYRRPGGGRYQRANGATSRLRRSIPSVLGQPRRQALDVGGPGTGILDRSTRSRAPIHFLVTQSSLKASC